MSRRWRLGRVFVLRHSGMPFDWLEGLGASPDLLRAADDLLDVERSLDVRDLPEPVRDAIAACAPERLPAKRTDLAAWRDGARRFRDLYREADERATERLRPVLENPLVGEAVFLSNPAVYRNMLLPLLSAAGPLNARRRRARRQLYTYLQRFCGKSETVSFFGPIAYGGARAGGGAVLRTDRPRARRVFVAAWAARELARALARDPRLLPDLRFHLTRPDGDGPDDDAAGPASAAVLAAIGRDGRTLRGMCRETGLPAREAARALRELVAAGVLDVALGAGPYDLDPLGALARQLGELPAAPARDLWLRRLRELERLRAALETEPFPAKVGILQELEGLFETCTGVSARRGAGRTYADRAIVYEECSSNFSLEVGEDLLRDWERRLGPVLEVCTVHGHAAQRQAARQVATAIRAEDPSPDGTSEMSLAAYAHRTTELFQPRGSAFQADHAPRYRGADDLHRLLREAATLDGDRYALIDLCPRAGDVAGLPAAGLVVARIHHHLQIPGWLDVMHPDPASFAAEAAAWLAEHGDRLVGFDFGRRNKGYYRFPGREVALRAPSWTDAGRDDLLRAEELTVRVERDGVRLTGPDERELRAYLPLSDFAKYPPYAALSHPQVQHPVFASGLDGRDEEVRVADVVVQRARWHVGAAEAAAATAEARFLTLRRLARRTGCRFVFVRSRRERKPYLIDLESPLAADLLGHVAPPGGTLTAEAMVPGPDELWLRDAEGRRYVCELRVQAIGRDAP
ncbi:lantibiotic dehydratase [Actinomadura chibensis]|uniref:Lantibiotic dehydratase n=1 Tax=Actinomadura chibensis TaxID=392828 RepID=A0A5D0NHY0_9ACTN|nr:lantibiotic dehydratase [Actinomadura chibensis]TYB43973.1 lantibiotic dehydratase [Actinomadura chibensis]